MAVLVCLFFILISLLGIFFTLVNQDDLCFLTLIEVVVFFTFMDPSSLCKASRKHYCTNRHVHGKENVDEEW